MAKKLISSVYISYCFLFIVMYVCAIISFLKIWRNHPCIWSRTILRAHFNVDNGLELIWTMVWNLSDQGHFGLELDWSEAASSALRAHNDLRAHSSDQWSLWSGTVWSEVPLVWDGLIRGNFERDLKLGNAQGECNMFETEDGRSILITSVHICFLN